VPSVRSRGGRKVPRVNRLTRAEKLSARWSTSNWWRSGAAWGCLVLEVGARGAASRVERRRFLTEEWPAIRATIERWD